MEIEQIDRDAAAESFAIAGWHGKAGSIKAGMRDDDPLVEAFAAHRIAALSARPDDSAEIERLRAALRGIAEADDPYEPCGWAINTAIAALGGSGSL